MWRTLQTSARLSGRLCPAGAYIPLGVHAPTSGEPHTLSRLGHGCARSVNLAYAIAIGYIGADVAYHGYREQEKGGDVKRAVAHATTFQVCVCVGATPQQQRRPGPHAPSSSSLQRVPLRTPTSQFVTQPCATQKLG